MSVTQDQIRNGAQPVKRRDDRRPFLERTQSRNILNMYLCRRDAIIDHFECQQVQDTYRGANRSLIQRTNDYPCDKTKIRPIVMGYDALRKLKLDFFGIGFADIPRM